MEATRARWVSLGEPLSLDFQNCHHYTFLLKFVVKVLGKVSKFTAASHNYTLLVKFVVKVLGKVFKVHGSQVRQVGFINPPDRWP